MNRWSEFFLYLNIKFPDAVAGMFGGFVKALMFHKDQPVEAIIATVIGAITANYLGEGVANQLSNWGISRGAACFITGITAMIVCQLVIDQVKRWTPKGAGK